MNFPVSFPFYWVLAPFILQGLLMAVDEFHYHRKRGLPDWERLGHPLDTLTVLVPLLFVRWASPSSTLAVVAFALLALLSCVFIAKDEEVHLQHSSGGEQRLHAFLFMLHPLLFLAMAALWLPLHGFAVPSVMERAEYFWKGETLLVTGFLAWQVFRWKAFEVGLKPKKNRAPRARSLKRAP